MNYDEAMKKSLSVPWKIDICNSGETCWCRVILPAEPIKYTHKFSYGEEREEEIEYIIPDGSVDKVTAEYIVKIHNEKFF